VPGNHDCAFDFTVPTEESLAAYRGRFGPDTAMFAYAGAFFVTLNTVVLDHPEAVPDELERQLAFLESSLREARRQSARSIVVFGHHPLFTEHRDEPDTYWNIPQPRRGVLLDLLKNFGVRAYFSGHWHRNGGGWDGDLEVVVSGPVGYPLGEDPSGFRMVNIAGDRLTHHYVALRDSALVSRA
jgi:3',5'-cyclic AMP phosphodiesterase CpdA